MHNGNLYENVIKELESLNCEVICRINYGHDIGAFKDINLLVNNLGISKKIEWLLWCNDSNFFLGGENAKIFEKIFWQALQTKKLMSYQCGKVKALKSLPILFPLFE